MVANLCVATQSMTCLVPTKPISSRLPAASSSRLPKKEAVNYSQGRYQLVRLNRRQPRLMTPRASWGGEDLPDIVPEDEPAMKLVPPGGVCCERCDGDGYIPCSKCEGTGTNKEDLFGGRFKAGEACWLCRGSLKMTCGDCNGSGYVFEDYVEDD